MARGLGLRLALEPDSVLDQGFYLQRLNAAGGCLCVGGFRVAFGREAQRPEFHPSCVRV